MAPKIEVNKFHCNHFQTQLNNAEAKIKKSEENAARYEKAIPKCKGENCQELRNLLAAEKRITSYFSILSGQYGSLLKTCMTKAKNAEEAALKERIVHYKQSFYNYEP